MNFRTTYILMGTAVALLIGMSLYVLFSDSSPTGEGYLLQSFRAASYKPEDITGFEVERDGEKLVFVRDGEGPWRMIAPMEARADSAAINMIVRQALEAKKVAKGVDLTSNLNTHGLEKPPVKLTFKKGDKSVTVSLGNVTMGDPSDSVIYILTPDSKKPQAIRRGSLSSLFKTDAKFGAKTDLALVIRWADDFRNLKLLGTDQSQDPMFSIVEVRLTQGKTQLDISRDNPEHVWRFKVPQGYGDAETDAPAGSNPAQISSVRELLNQAVNIQVAEAKHFIDKPADLKPMGLDPSSDDVLQVETIREDGTSQTLYLGKQIETEPDKVYAQLKGDSFAAMVNASAPRALLGALKNPINLRDKSLFKFRPERIDALDVDIAGSKFEFRQFAGFPVSWKIYSSDGAVAGANAGLIEALLKQLTQANIVQGFPGSDMKDDAMGFDKPAVEIKLWEKGIMAGEKPDPNVKPKVQEKPNFRIIFGKASVNPAQVYARRYVGDTKSDLLLPATLLETAVKPRVAYLEATLKSFSPDQVLSLTLNRGSELWEITRDEKEAKPAAESNWKIVAPPEKKGRNADAVNIVRILRDLASLKAVKVTTDKPTAEELRSLKLDPAAPRVKITVRVKDEPADRIYYLGDDVKDKPNVFAKTGDSPMVFEVAKTILDDSQTIPLQDMVVYRVDAAKLTGLKLKGWADLLDEVVTRELEKKDNMWVLKSDPTRAIDQSKVNSFLLDVTAPKADSVIEGGIKPEYKLDPKQGALEIELMQADSPPVTLTVGAALPDGVHVYAISNQAKGEVFTLLKDRFDSIRKKPAVFKKD